MADKYKKPVVLIVSVIALLCLIVRYPLMDRSVVLQIGTDGQPTKYVDKPIFSVCFALAVIAFDLYLFLIRGKDRELPWKYVIIFTGLCAVILAVSVF
jgi:hypothetical protein